MANTLIDKCVKLHHYRFYRKREKANLPKKVNLFVMDGGTVQTLDAGGIKTMLYGIFQKTVLYGFPEDSAIMVILQKTVLHGTFQMTVLYGIFFRRQSYIIPSRRQSLVPINRQGSKV